VTAVRTSQPDREREVHVPGEAGIWILILGDMTVFALLFGVYIEARSRAPGLFDASQRALDANLGALNTLLLLCSSLAVVTGVRAMRKGMRGVAPAAFVVAFACGFGFSLVKIWEWGHHLAARETPATNDFWMYYYILTGLHFFHLTVGMGLLIFLFTQARRTTLRSSRFAFVEGAACFWHMVDLLWVVIFPLLYLVR
jgi:nitric oxide reductase NorE protein